MAKKLVPKSTILLALKSDSWNPKISSAEMKQARQFPVLSFVDLAKQRKDSGGWQHNRDTCKQTSKNPQGLGSEDQEPTASLEQVHILSAN